jgi:transcriptional regulator with XRE-family HTH domain
VIEFRNQRIRELREANGMTLEEMAGKMGKPKQLVSVWENGVNSPSIENLVLICNTFDADPSFFFDAVSILVVDDKPDN